MKTIKVLVMMLCLTAVTAQAQVKVCMSYNDYKAD